MLALAQGSGVAATLRSCNTGAGVNAGITVSVVIHKPAGEAYPDRRQLRSRRIGARRILKNHYQNRVWRRHDPFAVYRFTFQNSCVSWEHVQGAGKREAYAPVVGPPVMHPCIYSEEENH